MNGIEYPVKIQYIPKFETQNPNIAINVFALEKSNDINTLYPLYKTNHRDRQIEIDLLYLERDDDTHYCLVKDLNSFISNNSSRKMGFLAHIALNDPTPGKRVHLMTPSQNSLKKISNITLKKISLHSRTPHHKN